MWLNPWHPTLKFENSLGGDAKMPARLALLAARRAPPKGSKGQCGLDPTTCRVPGEGRCTVSCVSRSVVCSGAQHGSSHGGPSARATGQVGLLNFC